MRKFTNLHSRVVRLGFSPEGTLTAAVRGGLQIGLWEMPAGKFRHWHPHVDGAVSSFAYSPDGKWLAIGGDIGLAFPILRAKGSYSSEIHGKRPIDAFAFSTHVVPGHNVLAVGSDRVRLYDLDGDYKSKDLMWDLALPSDAGWFRCIAFHPCACVVIGCDTQNKHIRVWNPNNPARSEIVIRKTSPTAAAFSTTGERMLVAYGSHSQLLESSTWKTLAECKHSKGRVTDIAASPCGRWFASSGTDHTVRFWNSQTGVAGPVFDWRVGSLTAVAFSPDGLTCAAGGDGGQVVIWDIDE
jgi:WD40 repeat protein